MFTNMKTIYRSLLIAATLAMPFLTSCKDDNDDNPVLKTPTSFVLNQPANAANVYDLENSEYIVLTTSQPDYGYTAPVTYTAFVSLDNANFEKIGATSTSTTVKIPAEELNTAILAMAGDRELSAPVELSVYLSAAIDALPDETTVKSNTITLSNILAYVPKVEISLPTDLFIVGGFPGSGWGTFVPFHRGYSTSEGSFFAIADLQDGGNFRFSTKAGNWGATFGWTDVTRNGELAEALTEGENDNNITFHGKSGLHLVMLKASVVNGAIAYDLTISPAKIYLVGGAAGGEWSMSEAFLFNDNGDGTASAVAAGDGELRLAVDCGTDWWKTEFTILNSTGELYYRDCDIPNNWASDCGDDYSFQILAGETVVLDFTTSPASGSKK